MLAGLVWLKDASCADLAGTDTNGAANWVTALSAAQALADGTCGLSDSSVAGDWRLPSRFELGNLFNLEYSQMALSDTAGTAQWSEGDPFLYVQWGSYWSSTSVTVVPSSAWSVDFFDGRPRDDSKTSSSDRYVWPVRGGASNRWAPARVGETGQKTCYNEAGTVIDCTGTGQDGDFQPGMEWPNPRFVDNSDGTVTDMLTGLIWLKKASCSDLAGIELDGTATWATAISGSALLANDTCGLSDGSEPGDWRLPSRFELDSLLSLEYSQMALSDTAGTAQWGEGDPFLYVQWGSYWSSTSCANGPSQAWYVEFFDGTMAGMGKEISAQMYVWPVRGGR